MSKLEVQKLEALKSIAESFTEHIELVKQVNKAQPIDPAELEMVLDIFISNVENHLMEKTGWGRNQIIEILNSCKEETIKGRSLSK